MTASTASLPYFDAALPVPRPAQWWRFARALASERAAALRARRAARPARPLQFTGRGRHRLLLVSIHNPIAQSQIAPFHEHASRMDLECLEIGLQAHLERPALAPTGADVVAFQTWFDHPRDDYQRIVRTLRGRNPHARLAFLDSFAPTDLRLAELLDPHLDCYVKKHLLRDRAGYGQPTDGDTNLSHWFGRRYGLAQPRRCFAVARTLLERKLLLGPSFCTAPYLWPGFARGDGADPACERPIDLHARLGGAGHEGWYGRMRAEAVQRVQALQGEVVMPPPTALVRKWCYLRELEHSKLCLSPFGYGEVCWRDYEAVHAGCLLLKPDMAHLQTEPDIFVPYDSYVPLRWDLSDLAEKVRHYLAHPEERCRIARNARARLRAWATSDGFARQMRPLIG